VATNPGQPGYQSLLSMLIARRFWQRLFLRSDHRVILIVLSLSANTAFADFPRLCRAIAQNNYLPHAFGYRGRALSTLTASLSLRCSVAASSFFSRVLPIGSSRSTPSELSWPSRFAVWDGSALVGKRGPHWLKSALVNGLGAFVTAINHHRCAGCEFRGRCLDYAALHPINDCLVQRCSPPLPHY